MSFNHRRKPLSRAWSIRALVFAGLLASCDPGNVTDPGRSGAGSGRQKALASPQPLTATPMGGANGGPSTGPVSGDPTKTGGGIERDGTVATQPPGTPVPTFLPPGTDEANPRPTVTPTPQPTETPGRPLWRAVTGLPAGMTVRALLASANKVFASDRGFVRAGSLPGSSPPPAASPEPGLPGDEVWALATFSDALFAGTTNGVYRLAPGNASWEPFNAGLPVAGGGGGYVHTLAITGSSVLAGVGAGVYESSGNGTWSALGSGFPSGFGTVYALAVDAWHVYAGGAAGTVYRVSRGGGAWAAFGTPPGSPADPVRALLVAGEDVYAGLRSGVARAKTSEGAWADLSDGLDGQPVNALSTSGTDIFAGTDAGVMRLVDGAWQPYGAGLEADRVYSLAIAGRYLIAGIEARTGGTDPSVWLLDLP